MCIGLLRKPYIYSFAKRARSYVLLMMHRNFLVELYAEHAKDEFLCCIFRTSGILCSFLLCYVRWIHYCRNSQSVKRQKVFSYATTQLKPLFCFAI